MLRWGALFWASTLIARLDIRFISLEAHKIVHRNQCATLVVLVYSVNAIQCHRNSVHARNQPLADGHVWRESFSTYCLDSPPPSTIPSKVQVGFPCLVRPRYFGSCDCSRSIQRLSQGRYRCCHEELEGFQGTKIEINRNVEVAVYKASIQQLRLTRNPLLKRTPKTRAIRT